MKCGMLSVCNYLSNKLSFLRDLPLLFMRLVLAYGFWGPAMMKWNNMDGIIDWFDSMGIPFPAVNAYLAATTEISGSVLLLLGIATRIISVPLMVVMLVAIFSVHITHGFEAGNNGFEIPLYYLIMLFTLMIYGPGRISLEGLLRRASGLDGKQTV